MVKVLTMAELRAHAEKNINTAGHFLASGRSPLGEPMLLECWFADAAFGLVQCDKLAEQNMHCTLADLTASGYDKFILTTGWPKEASEEYEADTGEHDNYGNRD